MLSFGQSQPAGRREDGRFLTGAGRYVADIVPQGALWAVFLRAPMAHAAIDGLDLAPARAAPGVRLVLDAAGLAALGVTGGLRGMQVANRDGSRAAAPRRPLLAEGRVRHLGEALAMVIADTPEAARDGAEAILADLSPLPVAAPLSLDGPAVHADIPGNRAFDYGFGDEAAVAAALDASAHRIALTVRQNRVTAAPIEPRAAFAEWDGARLHLCVNGQNVWTHRDELARLLDLPAGAVRVTTPDVGGGFGMKALLYPEYPVLAAAARALGRPVAWVADRSEAMLSDTAGRDLAATCEIGFDQDHRITALRVDVRANLGAYNAPFGQMIQSVLFSRVFTGAYDVPLAAFRSQGFYSHTGPVDAYRGAGRPEAILTLERTMDHAARVLGADPFALRQANLIRRFPHRMANGETIADGDFARVLARLRAEADLPGLPARRAGAAARGCLLGFGLAYYVEAILGDPAETARLRLEPDGTATLFVGTQSNGQGHETVYADLLSQATGLPAGAIRVVQGDSDAIPQGGGTGGSRSVTVQGSATVELAAATVAAFAEFLTAELGPGVALTDGAFGAPGSNRRLTLAEAAALARAAGRGDLLDRSHRTRLAGRSFPNGAHAAEVEIDRETGALRLTRYTVTDDFGRLIAPALVEGQVQGGIAQGYGQIVLEEATHDADGQLLAGSFMDYAMPRAADLPRPRFTTEPVPTATNPLGMKGCGEAGTVGALGAVANAVADALAQAGAGPVEMPFTPVRLWLALQRAAERGHGDP